MRTALDDLTVQLRVAPLSPWALRHYSGGHAVLHGSEVGGSKRLNQLFEARCDHLVRARQSHRLAVETEDESYTFSQVDELANRTANFLARRGIGPGDKVGLLFDRSIWSYVSMLAASKVGAVYVPMDKLFPVDRIEFIVEDSNIKTILSVSAYRELLSPIKTEMWFLDEQQLQIESEDGNRFRSRRILSGQDLAYIIYTSGSTGKPKGVPITHSNICNFVQVACDIYGLTPDDRVYQGLTLAFDFAVEEIWVPLVSGSTLVPAPSGLTLIGPDLTDFLRSKHITALCCVPTLLATVDTDIPELTFLLVSGEACPEELANRWLSPERRFLNVYGPTEATVSATWTELTAEGKVTIGGPLPSYSILILDPKEPRCLDKGEVGEIGIAGPGLAPGYLNREDKTKAAFIDDFIGIKDNPSGKIYRTGDLGRINEQNEIEYLGRIDTQVKIRGYRIELDEISSALMEAPGIAQAVVIDYETPAGVTDLAAYFTRRPGAAPPAADQLQQQLRDRMPPYMVPSSFQELDELPMLPSHKVDRRRLPEPGANRVQTPAGDVVAPVSKIEKDIAAVFAKVLGMEQVSTTGNFFDDLGASSLLLVHVCNELRTDPRFADVSVKDLYLHPTVSELASYLDSAPSGFESAELAPDRIPPRRASAMQHAFCGVLQTLWILFGVSLGALSLVLGGIWLIDAPTFANALARAVVVGPALFVASSLVSVVLKWVLIGRWKVERIPVWSFKYFRYWAAKTVIRTNPMRVFAGSPLYNLYLRLLGAKVGRGVSIFSNTPPVATDLVTISNDAVILGDTSFNGCKVEDGYVVTGPIVVRAHAHVGEACVLDVNTKVGNFGTLGHQSALHDGQFIPNFSTWHGSPAQPTSTDYRFVDSEQSRGTGRRFAYSLWRLLTVLVGLFVAGMAVWSVVGSTTNFMESSFESLPGSGGVQDTIGLMLVATVLYGAGLVLGLVPMVVVPLLGNLVLKPNRTYDLYGVHYVVARMVGLFGNSNFYNSLFGDSSLIVHFLRLIGYDLSVVDQTGVNFGLAQRQGNPLLCRVGTGTMVSDGLTMMNANYSNTSFTISPVAVGAANFLGNDVHIPAQSRVGDNCLLATKVMVPVDGEIRNGVGLLGSPAFEIPRSSGVEEGVDLYQNDPATRKKQLSRKLRHNMRSMVGYVAARYVPFIVLFATAHTIYFNRDQWTTAGLAAVVFGATLALLVGFVLFAAAVEWIGLGFKRLSPRHVSIYEPYYWYHERHWKWGRLLPSPLFDGTPLRPMIWRLLGVRIGRRVVDEGCLMPERSLTTIGDDSCLNERSTIQGHSLEDGVFKSDYATVGNACTIGVGAFVHYGTNIQDEAVLGPDSFLLKGETIGERSIWSGNPARVEKRLAPLRALHAPAQPPASPPTPAAPASAAG